MNWISEFEEENKDTSKITDFINGTIKEDVLNLLNEFVDNIENLIQLKLIINKSELEYFLRRLEYSLNNKDSNDPFQFFGDKNLFISKNQLFGLGNRTIQFLNFEIVKFFSNENIIL